MAIKRFFGLSINHKGNGRRLIFAKLFLYSFFAPKCHAEKHLHSLRTAALIILPLFQTFGHRSANALAAGEWRTMQLVPKPTEAR